MKHLKRGKRSRLDIIPTEKKSIIFGAASIERARAKMKEKESTWTADDGDFEETLVNWGVNKDGSSSTDSPRVGIFKAYQEDWEKAILKKKNTENEHLILAKYLGLKFTDLDKSADYIIIDQLEWNRLPGRMRGGQYFIMAAPILVVNYCSNMQ